MIPPSSAMVGQAVDKASFEARNNCYILGVQHHAHMTRSRMGRVKLLAGDMLLVQCAAEKLHDICDDSDVVLVELDVFLVGNSPLELKRLHFQSLGKKKELSLENL
jgi:hypothetical protein